MKRTLTLISIFASSICYSQINKGQWLAGGNASFNFSSAKNYLGRKQTIISLSPNAGYFIIDKLAMGARIGLTTTNSDYNEPYGFYNKKELSLSPFVRYYFLPVSQRVNILADASYTYNKIKEKYPHPDFPNGISSKTTAHGYTVSAGPSFFINQRISLEVLMSYIYKNIVYNYPEKTFMSAIGFQIHLGKIKDTKAMEKKKK